MPFPHQRWDDPSDDPGDDDIAESDPNTGIDDDGEENLPRRLAMSRQGGKKIPAKKLPRARPEGGADQSATGLVTEGARGMYWVATDAGPILCQVRGNLRKDLRYAHSSALPGTTLRHKVRRANHRARDPVTVGDRVRVIRIGGDRGLILEVLPPAGGAFTREDAGAGSHGGKGMARSVAGIDQLVAVFAARDPEPHLRLLDRMIVLAEAQEIDALICLNKVDLGPGEETLTRLAYYCALGYPTLHVSAETGEGLDDLRAHLAGRVSALLGPSGVGKSSLLNAIEPGLAQRVSEVGERSHKGRHTTSGTRLVSLSGADAGAVADTAGIRAFALGSAAVGQLDRCFREFRPYLGRCRHTDCLHVHEPGCVLRAAAETGDVDAERYDSYRRLVEQGAAAGGRVWRDLVSSRSTVGEGEFRL